MKSVKLRPKVKVFAQAMEMKFILNDHKGGWEETPITFLLQRLREETDELEKALLNQQPDEAFSEGVDISNFATMIVDRLGVLTETHLYSNPYLNHPKKELYKLYPELKPKERNKN